MNYFLSIITNLKRSSNIRQYLLEIGPKSKTWVAIHFLIRLYLAPYEVLKEPIWIWMGSKDKGTQRWPQQSHSEIHFHRKWKNWRNLIPIVYISEVELIFFIEMSKRFLSTWVRTKFILVAYCAVSVPLCRKKI